MKDASKRAVNETRLLLFNHEAPNSTDEAASILDGHFRMVSMPVGRVDVIPRTRRRASPY